LAGRNGKEKGGRVMKHKVEKDKLVELVKEWTRIMNTQIKEEGETNYKGK